MKRIAALLLALLLLTGVSVHGETGQVQWMESVRHHEQYCRNSHYDDCSHHGDCDDDCDARREACAHEQEVRDYLVSVVWEQFVQAPLMYTFQPDGSIREYFLSGNEAVESDDPAYTRYDLHGETLWVCDSMDNWFRLELMDAGSRYRWDRSVQDLIPRSGVVFYEADWDESDDEDDWVPGQAPMIFVPSESFSLKNVPAAQPAKHEGPEALELTDLLHGYWEMNFQSPMVYKFERDGEVEEYSGLYSGKLYESDTPAFEDYAFYGDVLYLGGDFGWCRLELVDRSCPVEWAEMIEDHLPEAQCFFYETGWQQPDRDDYGWQDDCPMYLVPSHTMWTVED